MSALLGAYGYRVVRAADGEQGVELAGRERTDLVLCDIHLPDMDGYEVARRIKAAAATRAIPVVAVSSLALFGEPGRLCEAGFDGCIAKPLEPASFVAQVERFLKSVRPRVQ